MIVFRAFMLNEFFCANSRGVVNVVGRQFPLHVFEPEVDVCFTEEKDLVDALKAVICSEAAVDQGGIIAFLRGRTVIELAR